MAKRTRCHINKNYLFIYLFIYIVSNPLGRSDMSHTYRLNIANSPLRLKRSRKGTSSFHTCID